MVLQARRAVSGGIHHVTRNLSSRHQVAPVLWVEGRHCASNRRLNTRRRNPMNTRNRIRVLALEEDAEYFEPSPIPTHHLGHEVALFRVGPNKLIFHNVSRLSVISQSYEL